jgi:multiple sugar transport system substrate-binding protein
MFVEHTLTTDMINQIKGFEDKTGIKVTYTTIPEANYFDKVSALLSSKSDTLDIFMTGPYQIWQYAAAGYMVDFDKYLNDASMVSPDYNEKDFYQAVLNSCRWDCVTGDATGTGSLWGIPLNFEADVLVYNKRLLKEKNLTVPKTTDELLSTCTALQNHSGEGTYGFACRGTLSWATPITAYQSFYTTFGGTDFKAGDDGKLVSTVNEKAGVDATDWFVKLVQNGGSSTWASTTYADAVGDVGAGTAGMCVDASGSCLSVCLKDSSAEWNNLAISTLPVPKEGDTPKTQLYAWSLAINSASKAQDAAWYFIQYITMPDVLHDMFVAESYSNPTRASTFDSDDYQAILSGVDGYIDTFKATVDNCTMYYTPNAHAFEVLETWCATLQDLVEKKYDSTQAGMDALADQLTTIVNE